MPPELAVADILYRTARQSGSATETVLEPGAASRTGEVWLNSLGACPALIIADPTTIKVAGDVVSRSLDRAGIRYRQCIIENPSADTAQGKEIAARIRADESLLAIGSGIINDLVKFAAFRNGCSYASVATAASMDGFASAGAPLSEKGFKKTIQCRPPAAIVGDIDLIAAAPQHLSSRGFGDIAGKIPAGADWILADMLGAETMDAKAFALVQNSIAPALAQSSEIGLGNREAIGNLFGALLLTGFAMQLHGSSRPASGADHQIAHFWEMNGLARNGEQVGHGYCVAVGCVAVLRLYEWLLARSMDQIDSKEIVAKAPGIDKKRQMIRSHFADSRVADRAAAETEAKHLRADEHLDRLSLIRTCWPSLKERIGQQLVSSLSMKRMLAEAGAPAEPCEIGVDASDMRSTVKAAKFLRQRYTVLDLLDETGLLDEALAEIFP